MMRLEEKQRRKLGVYQRRQQMTAATAALGVSLMKGSSNGQERRNVSVK